jgi:hypothetical protein
MNDTPAWAAEAARSIDVADVFTTVTGGSPGVAPCRPFALTAG